MLPDLRRAEDQSTGNSTYESAGFGVCESGPMVRSSYHADEQSYKFDVRERRLRMLAEQATLAQAEN